MKAFMDDDFLLETETARALFHGTAESQPIIDYHCHLDPQAIAENKKTGDLAEAWLGGDHYKWRQMRTLGVDERYVTGDAPPYEKFLAWASTVEKLIGNPLYHWTHLELRRFFGIDEPLTVKSAPDIWKRANSALQGDGLSVKGIFGRFKVRMVGTTDDPADSLEWHHAIESGSAPIGAIDTMVCPSFRPDRALAIGAPGYSAYIEQLAAAGGVAIDSVEALIAALEARLDYFVSAGCRSADHGMDRPPALVLDDEAIDRAFQKAVRGGRVSPEEAEAFRTKVLAALAGAYARKNVVMQIHMNVIRDNNPRAFRTIGPNAGHDACFDERIARPLARFLGFVSERDPLPKTVLYSLNPKDYYPICTVMGCFQEGPDAGKLQLGSAWWFCDHRDGMEEQLRAVANLGMLPAFVGMLTDSRSFLSYSRHEYFRRILCNLIGRWVENGEYPYDLKALEGIVRGVSFENAERYFDCRR